MNIKVVILSESCSTVEKGWEILPDEEHGVRTGALTVRSRGLQNKIASSSASYQQLSHAFVPLAAFVEQQ